MWRNSYYRTFYGPILHFLITFYFYANINWVFPQLQHFQFTIVHKINLQTKTVNLKW